MRFCTAQVVQSLIISLLLTTTVLPTGSANYPILPVKTSSLIEDSDGLKTVVFDTDAGRIRVNMPEDMQAGDNLSGTVYVSAKGKNEKEIKKNREELDRYVVDVAGQTANVSNRNFRFELPESLTDGKFRVALQDGKGKQLAAIDVPASQLSFQLEEGEFQSPEGGQAGRWIRIRGSFDGDLSNTQVSVGGTAAEPLAESPRQSLFQSPVNVIGPTELMIEEGNTRIVRQFRNIDVKLTAAKLNLQKGETTQVLLNVSGLGGIEEELPLHLTCTGSADMQGGNIQNLQISPNELNGEGQFLQTRTLVGNQIGNFNVKATVLFDAGVRLLDNNLVHIEGTPQKMGDVWGVRVRTLDGKIKWVFFTQEPPPIVKSCLWIRINKSETDEDGDTTVDEWEPADNPNQPCLLENKTVHIEGSPLKMPDGRWQIKVELPGGGTGYIYVRAPQEPDLKLCNWIKVSGCKKLSNSTFEVDGYDVTEDPNKPSAPEPVDPAPPPTHSTVPPRKPEDQPLPAVKPCTPEGATKPIETRDDTFQILSEGSQLKFSITTSNSGNSIPAEGMAGWLTGLAKIGSILTGNLIPDDQAVGGGIADAVLKYIELGGDIAGAVAKSNFKNLNTLWVEGHLETRLIKVMATCTEYEICINGKWIKKKKYTEEREIVDYSDTVKIVYPSNDWDQVSNTSRPQSLDPDKAEKYLLRKLIEKLKANEVAYGKFKEKCK